MCDIGEILALGQLFLVLTRLMRNAYDLHFRVQQFIGIKDETFQQVIEHYESWYGLSDYPHLGRFKP